MSSNAKEFCIEGESSVRLTFEEARKAATSRARSRRKSVSILRVVAVAKLEEVPVTIELVWPYEPSKEHD